ncbi:MAG TPA: hypothetical protein VJR29_09725 [bacterium]|nr:hypothetical protein [bacterium]
MTPIVTGSSSETQHLGHQAPPPPNTGPGTYQYQQPAQKKGGCGCGCGCFSGCLILLLLLGGFLAFVYFFGFKDDRYIGHIDRVVVWTYEGAIRPKLASQFTMGMNDQDRARFLQLSDAAVDKYLALPPQEKKEILKEAAVAFWHLQNGTILPPEQIPHLKKFIDSLDMRNGIPPPNRSSTPPPQRQIQQETPRRPIAPPKESPRLLN